ncbi:MAG TPA: Asp-tRNA(Asn)/Glu-tRNA(Gln) amidotransferase GatCAB subunit C [Ruminococcaceae bacterium]|nr:Asp-tRNA(Asn)/Glu-tRNA(Gln) amidotransferase GatCAB subunit C [Oscillospiraceae bacterium]
MEQIDVMHLAKLARLRFDDAAAAKMGQDMQKIVGMVADLPDFTETRLPLDIHDRMELRRDEQGKSLSREEVLANAPQTEAGCVVVPKIME